MKILIISYEFPPQTGGIATYSHAIAKYLHLLNHEITVLAHTENPSSKAIKEFDELQKYEIIRFKKYKSKIYKIFGRIIQSIRMLKSTNFDIVLFTYSHAAIIGHWIHRTLEIPFVITCHGAELIQKYAVMRFIIKKLFLGSDLILANSDYSANLLKNMHIPDSKIKTIYLGADDEIFDYKKYNYNSNELKQKFGLDNRRIITTVGSIKIMKAHHVVIHALQTVKTKFPDIMYLIVGSGHLEKSLKELVKSLQLEENVRFLGVAYDKKLAEYYALSDIIILNSGKDEIGRTETFGLVLIEANLMGKPVIGTDGNGISSAIEHKHSGLIIPMNDSEATANAIISLFENPDYMKILAMNGYKRAKSFFTWKSVAKRTEFEMKNLLESYYKS